MKKKVTLISYTFKLNISFSKVLLLSTKIKSYLMTLRIKIMFL